MDKHSRWLNLFGQFQPLCILQCVAKIVVHTFKANNVSLLHLVSTFDMKARLELITSRHM